MLKFLCGLFVGFCVGGILGLAYVEEYADRINLVIGMIDKLSDDL